MRQQGLAGGVIAMGEVVALHLQHQALGPLAAPFGRHLLKINAGARGKHIPQHPAHFQHIADMHRQAVNRRFHSRGNHPRRYGRGRRRIGCHHRHTMSGQFQLGGRCKAKSPCTNDDDIG